MFLLAALAPIAALTPSPSAPPGVSSNSPLGRFADVVTAIVSVGVIAAALASHLGIVGTPDAFIDSVALIAVGILYGTARGVAAGRDTATYELGERANLNTSLTLAAHDRLDKLGAPPAPFVGGLEVGAPSLHGSPGTAVRVPGTPKDPPPLEPHP